MKPCLAHCATIDLDIWIGCRVRQCVERLFRNGTFLANGPLATGLSGVGLLAVPNRCLTGLLMPSFAVIRRSKLLLDNTVAPLQFREAPAVVSDVCPTLSWVAIAARPVLRVGDYEVGETFCPRLCGHPGIRY